MPRIRMEFSRGDQVRFLSHLDIMKAFERAIRRAGIPVAFSEGFNPHPRMSFASALAVGVVGEREYLDIELNRDMGLKDVMRGLAGALPQGIDIKAGRVVPDRTPSLMAEVNRAVYMVTADTGVPVDADEVGKKITAFMNAPEIIIEKKTKKGFRARDIRPGIIGIQADTGEKQVKFSVMTVTGSEGNVRPEEAVRALADYACLPIDCDSLYIKRIALYIEKDGKLINPLDI